METNLKPCAFGAYLWLLPLCIRAIADSIYPQLPVDVAINEEAGRGGPLIVTLRLESGEELPFLVDTGAPATLIDKSLEPKLGRRLGATNVISVWDKEKSGFYAMPKLYLGGTRLMTGDRIVTHRQSPHTNQRPPRASFRIMGTLGVDCLRHYCVQLDFEAGKLRFLDSDSANAAEFGKAFPLTFNGGCPHIHDDGFVGGGTNLIVDVGCSIDGLVNEGAIKGLAVLSPGCVWEGHTYTNIMVAAVDHANVLGLRFLARHLVTLDFPKQTMYLKQASIGPLTGDVSMRISPLGDLESPAKCLERLRKRGELPGWSEGDEGEVYLEAHSPAGHRSFKSVTLEFRKGGDMPMYHYRVTRASEDSPWVLRKAWWTDKSGVTSGEFPVP